MSTFKNDLGMIGSRTKGLFLGLSIVISVLIVVSFFLGRGINIQSNTVIELTSCKNIGAIGIVLREKLPKLIQDSVERSFPQLIDYAMVQYAGFGADELLIPEDGKWGLIYTTEQSTSELVYNEEKSVLEYQEKYHGEGKITGFAISGIAYKPYESSQMVGEKYYLSIKEIWALSETMHPIGVTVENKKFNKNFTPDAFTNDFSASLQCWFTIVTGSKKNDMRCSETGFRPDTNFQMQGIADVQGSGFYVVEACPSGIWIKPITSLNEDDDQYMSAAMIQFIGKIYQFVNMPDLIPAPSTEK